MTNKPDPRRDMTNAAFQINAFGRDLERMNAAAMFERNRQRRRVLALIGAGIAAILIFWTLKDAPAKIAATVFQAEQVPSSW